MESNEVTFPYARHFLGRVSARRFWRHAALAVFVFAVGPAMAGIGGESGLTAPNRPDLTCTHSTSSTRQLAMIDSKSDGGFQCIGVLLDGRTVKAIRLEGHNFASAAQPSAEQRVKITEFPPAIVDSSRGAVLDGIPGHDAIILRGHLPTPSGKAELEISFLYNGLTGEYRSCQITLDRTPDAGWRLINSQDQPISHIVVRIRQLPVIGVIGIADLEGACAS
jgi:hypothetical protein